MHSNSSFFIQLPTRCDESSPDQLKRILLKLMAGKDLNRDESRTLMHQLFEESTNNSRIAAALVALSIKGETPEELAGMADIMRERAVEVRAKHKVFVDTAGTGSSRVKTFNVSTAAAFVIAGAGLPVAKHGSRAATSKSGSADVLEELGVRVAVSPATSEECLNETGMCFLFAVNYHAATFRIGQIRRELGVHTTFNLLGPMTNPAGAPHQVLGVWHPDLVERVALTLKSLGTRKSWIVHGSDGLDELTLSGPSFVAEVTPQGVDRFEVTPENFGLKTVGEEEMAALRGNEARPSAVLIRRILDGAELGPARDLVVMNAAAALVVANVAPDMKAAAQMAQKSIDSGKARKKLDELIRRTMADQTYY